ncbi:hypothetical protein AV530_005773 [Patagioenas fasciata monilis]|uniref:Uncharacterized protein n=1 Tax=Patagioenas fasciata monilis TaxID=372326 RepID=A0A1V4JMI9_PATFA|nr:hypothetical protein AV530_005773 [Patagioenas fasciata monilis]
MMRQAVPLQHMEVNGEADTHLQSVEDPMPEQVDVSEGGCDSMGRPAWNRLLAGPVDLWREEPTLEQQNLRHDLLSCFGKSWSCGQTHVMSVNFYSVEFMIVLYSSGTAAAKTTENAQRSRTYDPTSTCS